MRKLFLIVSFLILIDAGWRCFSCSGFIGSISLAAPPVEEGPFDLNGHNEAWWREKISKWETKREEATRKLGEAETELAKLKFQNLTASMEQVETNRLLEEIDMYRKQAIEANEMLNKGLPEEARKAGAPPGWLR